MIGLALDGECRIVHACVEADDVAEGHVVFGIEGGLVGKDLGRASRGVIAVRCRAFAGIVMHRLHVGPELVVGVAAAKANLVVGQGTVIKVDFASQVVDTRLVGHAHLFFLDVVIYEIGVFLADVEAEVVAVLRVVDRGVHEEFLRHHMVPAQGAHFVAPGPVEAFLGFVFVSFGFVVLVFYAEVDSIVAGVEAQIEAVFVGDFPIEFGVEVVEVIACAQFGHVGVGGAGDPQGGLQQEVAVGAAKREVKRQLVLHDGAFEVEFR